MNRIARVLFATCLVVACLLAGAAVAGHEVMTATCVKVVDGDTLIIECDQHRRTVDLAGIDAPELDQPWGREVRSFVRDMVRGQQVEVVVQSEGDDAVLARVSVGGRDLAEILVGSGLAWVAEDESDPKLVDLGGKAREMPCGLWIDDNPVPPWQHRAATS